jgi:hypothetical protein
LGHQPGTVPETIHDTNLRLLLVGGEAEGDDCNVGRRLPPERARVAQNLPWPNWRACWNNAPRLSGMILICTSRPLYLPGLVLWGAG